MPPLTWLARHFEDVLLILSMGVLSGVAQFWINLRSGKATFSAVMLVGEICISASATVICGMLLLDYVPLPVVLGVSGVAGHMGTRFIYAMEQSVTDRLRRRIDPH